MGVLGTIYRHSLALLTDLYQLTMAQGYWKTGLLDREAVFHLTFRQNPFGGGFSISCGLGYVVDLLADYRLDAADLTHLAELHAPDGTRLFAGPFLDYLGRLRLSCDVDAVPEGTVVFPHEPLVRVRGPLLEAQVLETVLLTLVNFQTLVATKAARICLAARGEPVVDFGLRRAQGIDGGLAASRAAFVGGCASTSNVLAGKLFGIPVRGTHAHSWVLAFDDEREAFAAYAACMPGNCTFLVDTYDTLQGVRHAVEVGRRLREGGHELAGIRLDSGDLTRLSIEARRILDDAGFSQAAIVASNELDEHAIDKLKREGARINVWGVGTRLDTAYDQPALGGVYKLAAIRGPGQEWRHKVKLSEQTIKVSNPGIQQVRRYESADGSQPAADMIYNLDRPPEGDATLVDLSDGRRRLTMPAGAPFTDLLVPILRAGRVVYDVPSPTEARARTERELARLSPEVKALVSPAQYPVGLERGLHELKAELIHEARHLPEGPRRRRMDEE